MGYKWHKMTREGVTLAPPSAGLIAETMRVYSLDEPAALKLLDEYSKSREYWRNDLYQVEVTRNDKMVHLNIRRVDGNAVLRDWRHFQLIKNDIVGEECEAIELYPAESRLVDTSNKYHLYAVADPSFRFPIGFDERAVCDERNVAGEPGMRQRRL